MNGEWTQENKTEGLVEKLDGTWKTRVLRTPGDNNQNYKDKQNPNTHPKTSPRTQTGTPKLF